MKKVYNTPVMQVKQFDVESILVDSAQGQSVLTGQVTNANYSVTVAETQGKWTMKQ